MTSLNFGYINDSNFNLNLTECPDPNITNLTYNVFESFETNPNNIINEIKIIHNNIKNLLNSTDVSIIDTYLNEINDGKNISDDEKNISDDEKNISDDLITDSIKIDDVNNKEKQTDISLLNEKSELEKFDESIEKFKIDYKNIQEKFLKIQEKFKKEIETNKEDIHITNQLLNHATTVNSKYNNDEAEELLQNIKNLSNSILNNSKIKEIKKEYLDIKNELDSFLKIVKKINGFNLGSMCICCISNPVTMCFNPCGHTICEVCLERIKGDNYDFECLVCRNKVNSVIKIYYS